MVNYFKEIWRKWAVKVGLSITDQVIVSGANLVLNIFLVRWLAPSEYGIFAIVFSVFLFLTGLYQALILEPMSVLGAAHRGDNFGRYIGVSLWLHAGVTSIFSVIILLVTIGMVIKNSLFVGSFFGLAMFTPFILFFWFFRQVCYLQMKPKIALIGSLTYAFVMFLCLFGIYNRQWLSPFSALAAMGIASLSAAVLLWFSLGIGISNIFWSKIKVIVRKVFIDNWRYGRWVIGSAFVNWLSIIVYIPMVGIIVGFSQAGVFRAMENLVLPAQRIFIATGILALPWLSGQRLIHGKNYVGKKVLAITVINVLFSVSYVAVLIMFREGIVKLLYGESYYLQFLWLVPYLGAVVIIGSLVHGLYLGLKAMERPDAVFWSQTAAVAVTMTIGLYLVMTLKLYGAVLGCIVSSATAAIVPMFFMFNHLRSKEI